MLLHHKIESFKPLILFLALGTLLCAAAAYAQTQGAGTASTGMRRALHPERGEAPASAYTLQSGDTVVVAFRYTPEFNDEVIVGPDGSTMLKAAGLVRAEGLTAKQFEVAVAQAAKRKLIDPEVTVTLKDFDRPHVFVAGEVNAPGRQDLRRPTTALQAILMCGGPKDDAALGRVLLFRRIDAETAEVHVLQLARYGHKARRENDMLLEPDDMLLIRHDIPSRVERYIKVANVGFYLNPLQNVGPF